jgi:predicted dehydrogenase
MIKIGIIGTGAMAHAHANEFGNIQECKVVACSDTVPGKAREFADGHGIPAAYEDNVEMLDREDLDAVSVVTPDRYHMEPVLQVIERGLHVMCEKPLASSLEDAQRMTEAAVDRGILTCVNFSYRNAPAVQEAARMVSDGVLGRIYHVEGSYLQSWGMTVFIGEMAPGPWWQWRMSTRHGSAGTLGDIGIHLLDLAAFVVGDIDQISCALRTFDKPVPGVGEYVFDANDSMVSTVGFANGAIGSLHSSRLAFGHGNTVALRVFGQEGALDINLDRPEENALRACLVKNGKPGMFEPGNWEPVTCLPVPNMYRRFITSILDNRQGQTSFEGALNVQRYLDACFRSAASGCDIGIHSDSQIGASHAEGI